MTKKSNRDTDTRTGKLVTSVLYMWVCVFIQYYLLPWLNSSKVVYSSCFKGGGGQNNAGFSGSQVKVISGFTCTQVTMLLSKIRLQQYLEYIVHIMLLFCFRNIKWQKFQFCSSYKPLFIIHYSTSLTVVTVLIIINNEILKLYCYNNYTVSSANWVSRVSRTLFTVCYYTLVASLWSGLCKMIQKAPSPILQLPQCSTSDFEPGRRYSVDTMEWKYMCLNPTQQFDAAFPIHTYVWFWQCQPTVWYFICCDLTVNVYFTEFQTEMMRFPELYSKQLPNTFPPLFLISRSWTMQTSGFSRTAMVGQSSWGHRVTHQNMLRSK